MVSSTHRPHFTSGKDPVPILQEAGWAPGPVWTGGKSRPHRDSILDRPARSQSLYRLSYRAHKETDSLKSRVQLPIRARTDVTFMLHGSQIRIQLMCMYRSIMRISRQLLIANQQMLFDGEFEINWISETSLYSLRFIKQCNVYCVTSLSAKRILVFFLNSNRVLMVTERSKLRYPNTDNKFSLVTILYRSQI